jgi:hypothetical protein
MNLIQLQPGYEGREVFAACIALPPDAAIFRPHSCDYADRNVTPVGDVEFCEEIMRKQGIEIPKPDFYPTWLGHWMHRMYAIHRNEYPAVIPTFVKSAESYKEWPAKIVQPGEMYPTGMLCLSEVVTFTQEWRYYVANGEVVTTGWYDGSNDDEPAPELGIDWPVGFCGAVDFGRLDTGEIALVECHHPYACGHYSDDNKAFVQWLIDGFNYMKANFSV